MPLEKQATSLELSQKLRDLGVKQDGHFTWIKDFHTNDSWKVGDETDLSNNQDAINRRLEPWYIVGPSAFSVAELGELMKGKGMGVTAWADIQTNWWVRGGEWIVEKQQYSNLETDDKWADALAKMLIYLIENKLITI